ncbi:MAG TPA: AIM24 family protein [Allosphingosinicella sp.]|nr:AIM24 family protein [Allosphingosinicella sp.]
MDANWGSNGGGYGGPPQSGFGRKRSPLPDTRPDDYTMSQVSAQYYATHQAKPELVNDIDFVISEGDMQYAEIELDPGESVVAEPGALIWKDSAIVFDMILGDGSKPDAGLGAKLASAAKNAMAGENMFLAEFKHEGSQGKARLAVGGRTPGHIIPVRLDAMGGSLICQRRSFLAAARGIGISIAMQRRLRSAIFGDEGFVMQRLTGAGWAFLHVGGSIIERELQVGEIIHVDGGCVAAHEPQVETDIMQDSMWRGIKTGLLGDEGGILTAMRGPGKVWIQTLPFSRVAAETAAATGRSSLVSGVSIGDAVGIVGGVSRLLGDGDGGSIIADGLKGLGDML